jgi:hypothetical protein
MTRLELVKQLADAVTRPVDQYALEITGPTPLSAPAATQDVTDLYVWFEDTAERLRDGSRGAAGLPESLLPWPQDGETTMKIIDRRYAAGHLHLLAAVRLRVRGKYGERIAAIYTAALSVGTVAWIGTGSQYEQAWDELYAAE